MGSEGKEFDIEEDSSLGIDLKERMAKQRQLLNSRLGLDVVSKIGIDISGLFSNEDLVVAAPDAREFIKTEDNAYRVSRCVICGLFIHRDRSRQIENN